MTNPELVLHAAALAACCPIAGWLRKTTHSAFLKSRVDLLLGSKATLLDRRPSIPLRHDPSTGRLTWIGAHWPSHDARDFAGQAADSADAGRWVSRHSNPEKRRLRQARYPPDCSNRDRLRLCESSQNATAVSCRL